MMSIVELSLLIIGTQPGNTYVGDQKVNKYKPPPPPAYAPPNAITNSYDPRQTGKRQGPLRPQRQAIRRPQGTPSSVNDETEDMAHKNYQNHRLVPEQPPAKLVSPNTADSRYNIYL